MALTRHKAMLLNIATAENKIDQNKRNAELQRADPGKNIRGDLEPGAIFSHTKNTMPKIDLYYSYRFSWKRKHTFN